MPELGAGFWHGWIVGLTVISLIALVWLTVSVYFSRREQGGGPDDVVWDETLREEANPAPWWWFALLLGLLVFTVIYLILYPGLGDYPGMLRWSQETQIEQSLSADADANAGTRTRWRGLSAAELGADAAAMRTAGRLFRNHCAACHGEDAGGITAIAPDLTDGEWNWGGDEAQIRQTITAGRHGVMPPMGELLGDAGVDEVAEFVLSALSAPDGGAAANSAGDAGADNAGRAKYRQFCAACHGEDGKGNPLLGAPDLTNDRWFYGGDPATVRTTIRAGRSNQMPPQGQRLNKTQVQLLTAWLLSQHRTPTR